MKQTALSCEQRDAMTRTRDISELVSRAQKGDRQSLGVLSAHVRRRMFVYLYRMTLDYHLAEDLVQETVLYMIESLPRLETASSSSLWAWIYRSAWGIFQHYVRPQGHQRIVQKTVVDHEVLLQLTDQTKESALEQAERAELFAAICESLGTLQARHRSVLVLRCFESFSYAEIASVMGCSEVRARVLFFHAKHALKRQLHNRGFGRRYFLTSLSLFGMITATHTKSTSAAVTVTSSLVRTQAVAAAIGAITAKLGVVRTAVITTAIVAGTICVCTSDADVPTESTIKVAAAGDESAFSMPEQINGAGLTDSLSERVAADPLPPDPCDVEPDKPQDVLSPGPGGTSRPAMPASAAQPEPQVGQPAGPNGTETKVEHQEPE